MSLRHVTAMGIVLSAAAVWALQNPVQYHVLDPVTVRNMTVFPVTAERTYKTDEFLTLDEGIKTGEVLITEGGSTGIIRRGKPSYGVWHESPSLAMPGEAQVNQLNIINRSDRPLILLAGEIVTGGKQDRIVGKDRIIPGRSGPVNLDVFCIEPHRWMGGSAQFTAMPFTMAQPGVRKMAQGEQSQVGVWQEVAKTREALAVTGDSSSYAVAMSKPELQQKLDSMAGEAMDEFEKELRTHKAVGAVIAVNNRIVWADVFASPELLDRYWPKLVRSYAAEALTWGIHRIDMGFGPSREDAQQFLDHLPLNHESIETDPGIFRSTEITGPDFRASLLTTLIPGTGFTVHLAKMRT